MSLLALRFFRCSGPRGCRSRDLGADHSDGTAGHIQHANSRPGQLVVMRRIMPHNFGYSQISVFFATLTVSQLLAEPSQTFEDF